MKLSVIIPVYNERQTIQGVIHAVQAVKISGMEKELIIVDDGSHDGTRELLKALKSDHYSVYFHERNRGKGAAVRTGFAHASGDIILIQDADLEYDPAQYPLLIAPILNGDADVVYGSRFISAFPRRVLYFSHYLANTLLTLFSNILTGLNLSDMETGYKVFSRKAVWAIAPCLRSERFGIEPELTAQVAKHKLRIYEVGISYRGRTYPEGKKITWKDGFAALWHIIRFNILTRT